MWEIYVEPNLERQGDPPDPEAAQAKAEADAIAAGVMFGIPPDEIREAVRKSRSQSP